MKAVIATPLVVSYVIYKYVLTHQYPRVYIIYNDTVRSDMNYKENNT